MKNKLIIITILFAVFFSSCISVVDFKDDELKPRLVVNGFINPDTSIQLVITQTRSMLGVVGEFKSIKHANVDIFEEDVFVEKLIYSENYDTTFYYSYEADPDNPYAYNRVKHIERIDTTTLYSSSFKPEIGKTYKIEVSKEGYDNVNSSIVIPESVPILGLDTNTVIVNHTDYIEAYTEIKLKFQDPAEVENYYRLKIKYDQGNFRGYEYTYEPGFENEEGHETDSIAIIQTNTFYENYSVSSNDIVLTGEDGADDVLLGSPSNRYNIFTDELINGMEHDLTFNISNGYLSGAYDEFNPEIGEFIKVTFTLESIAKESYLYMNSYNNFRWIDGDLDMFIEPVQVYNNIENGAGIFGASNPSKWIITKGEYPRSDVIYQANEPYDYWYYYW